MNFVEKLNLGNLFALILFCFHKYFDVAIFFCMKDIEYLYESSLSESTTISLQNAILFQPHRLKIEGGNTFFCVKN